MVGHYLPHVGLNASDVRVVSSLIVTNMIIEFLTVPPDATHECYAFEGIHKLSCV